MKNIIGIHHIGCAVSSIEKATKYYTENIGYVLYKNTFVYEEENIQVAFLKKGEILLELIEKKDKTKPSPIDKIIAVLGGGVYHECYLVNGLEEVINQLRKDGFVKLRKKNMQYENMVACYMITPDNHLIEFIEVKDLANC